MPSRPPLIRQAVPLALAWMFVLGMGGSSGSDRVLAFGEPIAEASTKVADGPEDNAQILPFPKVEESKRSNQGGGMTSDRWPASLAVVFALVLLGAVGLASRKFRPSTDRGPLQVVGRAALSPKHAVYLLRVGDRVLIVGAGTQGPPALLGELNDPEELHRLIPRREPSKSSGSASTELLDSGEPNGEKACE